jgi:hypothetical protein
VDGNTLHFDLLRKALPFGGTCISNPPYVTGDLGKQGALDNMSENSLLAAIKIEELSGVLQMEKNAIRVYTIVPYRLTTPSAEIINKLFDIVLLFPSGVRIFSVPRHFPR